MKARIQATKVRAVANVLLWSVVVSVFIAAVLFTRDECSNSS